MGQEVPAGGGGRRRAPARPQTYTLREEDDGWEAIQDAQNAAATLALHAVWPYFSDPGMRLHHACVC